MMSVENFQRHVTRQPLCAGVPAAHAAVFVEHENRVVVHAVDQNAHTFFALAQLNEQPAVFLFAIVEPQQRPRRREQFRGI